MNSYRYGFNGQEREKEINPSVTSAEFWMYDGRLGRRWNMDPKPNPSISDYATFANNPILFRDANGDTAINGMNPVEDAMLYKIAQNQKDEKNTIYIHAHGNNKMFSMYLNGKNVKIQNAKDFDNQMKLLKVTEWDNLVKGEEVCVILHSCRTGKETSKQMSIARQISTLSDKLTVIAPDERTLAILGQPQGPTKKRIQDEDGNLIDNRKKYGKFLGTIFNQVEKGINYIPSGEKGSWHIFYKGEDIHNMPGDWNPTNMRGLEIILNRKSAEKDVERAKRFTKPTK